MKPVILITLFAIIHHSTATIDIIELKKTAKENLQALHETAASELGKIVASINLENAKKVDIFHVIPKVTKLKKLLTGEKEMKKETLILDPYQAERLSHYFDHHHHHDDYHHHHHGDYHHHHVISG